MKLEQLKKEARERLYTSGVDGFAIDLDLDELDKIVEEVHQAGVKDAMDCLYEVDVDKKPTISESAVADMYLTKEEAFWYGEAQAIQNIREALEELTNQ